MLEIAAGSASVEARRMTAFGLLNLLAEDKAENAVAIRVFKRLDYETG